MSEDAQDGEKLSPQQAAQRLVAAADKWKLEMDQALTDMSAIAAEFGESTRTGEAIRQYVEYTANQDAKQHAELMETAELMRKAQQ